MNESTSRRKRQVDPRITDTISGSSPVMRLLADKRRALDLTSGNSAVTKLLDEIDPGSAAA